jgi:UDP-N-acetylglucosamine:LPS N-acetylglucosamine transferase
MEDVKKIVILMADLGFGHRSAAKAVAAALQELYGDRCEVEIVNPLDDERTPAVVRSMQTDYDGSVRQLPALRKLGYQFTDTAIPNAAMEAAFTVTLFDTLRDVVRRHRPDAIVTTFQSYLAPLDAVLALEKQPIPLLTVITDLVSLQRMWFNDAADLCLVPTEPAYELALSYGLPPEKIKITGVPVNPRLWTEQRQPHEIRRELGWRDDLTTVLAVGSKRVLNLPETLHVLNHSGLPLQLVIVAGGDDELYEQLRQVEWHSVTHLYNYVEDMPAMLRTADCILSKAGGLIIAEALAAGLPILLFDVIEGWETGNAQYVVENGAGEHAKDPVDVLEIMYHWLDRGGELLQACAQNARQIGRPRAAYDAAELIWQAAQTGPAPRDDSVRLPIVTDLLDRFNIAWRDTAAKLTNSEER